MNDSSRVPVSGRARHGAAVVTIGSMMLLLCHTAAATEEPPVLRCPAAPAATANQSPDECDARLAAPNAEKLLSCAAKAQEQAQQLRKDLDKVYESANAAAQSALNLKLEGHNNQLGTAARSPDGRPLNRGELISCTRDLQKRASTARDSLQEAQKTANAFVDAALALKADCGPVKPKDCVSPDLIDTANRLHGDMAGAMATAKANHEELRELFLVLKVDPEWAGADARQALQFERLLRDFPEVQSVLGDDSGFISAGTKDATAALRLSFKLGSPVLGLRRAAITLSTPLGDDKSVKLYDRADGLPRTTLLTVSSEFYRGSFMNAQLSVLSVGISAGFEKKKYLLEGAAPTEEERTVHAHGLSLTWARFNYAEGNRTTHVAKLGWQRTFEDGDAAVLCPLAVPGDLFVKCLQGPVGAPQRHAAGVLSYQWRLLLSRAALAPKLTYNTRSQVWDGELPIYLVRSSDDTDKRPFNAGFTLGYASKGKASITDRSDGLFRFGVFIGAPFSLGDYSE